jgi:dipeptidyl aminopeptidase/acylaminoacyl peptidase
MPRPVAVLVALLVTSVVTAQAPTLPPLPVSAFERIETVLAPTVSPRGTWVAYPVRRLAASGDSSRMLHLRRLSPDTTLRMDWAQSPQFSANDRWGTWIVTPTDAERARLTSARQPVRNRAVILELATLRRDSVDGVATARFDASGRFLLLEHYAARDSADHRLVTVVELATGRRTVLGGVAEWQWSTRGSLLAFALGVRDGGPGGLQLFDAASGVIVPIGAVGQLYRQLQWRKESADLAALRALTARGGNETAHHVEAWRDLHQTRAEARVLNDSTGLPDSLMVVAHSALEWSPDGSRIRVGVRPRPAKADSGASARRDTLAGVQIWHPNDVQIFPAQQLQAPAANRRSVPAIWDLRSGTALVIDAQLTENVELLEGWRHAYVTSDAAYPWGAMFGRRYHDGFLVDLASGVRSSALDSVRYSSASGAGRYLLWFDGTDYHTLDVRNGRRRNITAGLGGTFANVDFDTPTDVLPPHGRAGWLDDDAGVLLYDEFDVWLVRPDGSGGSRLTRGIEDSTIHRVVTLQSGRRTVDPRQPLLYSLRGLWTEQRGFARGTVGRPAERLLLRDRSYWFVTKADSADVLVWREESRQHAPELFASDGAFRNIRPVSSSNAFLAEHATSRVELVRFTNETGRPLKGILLYPVNHDPAKQYPMIVYAYELLSSQMHNWQAPNERVYYNFARWAIEGYFVLMPDIHFRHGDPGVSLLETLRPAVASVTARGLVDAKRVGFVGHSWGGYHGAYVATHSHDFAASVAGAPLTDFLSFMGQIHWNGGVAEVDHWETGQARMGVPYWEDRDAHRRNSPIERVDSMTTPLLLMHGNRDRVVEYFQSTIFYNFARRAGKPVVFLTYEDEDHSLQQTANQVDYHRRLLEWFGHHLKGEPAAQWITRGVPFPELEAERRRLRDGPASPQ